MKRLLLSTTVAAAIAAVAAPASANLLVNGDFEDPGGVQRTQVTAGLIPGWTYGSFGGSFEIYEDQTQDGLAAASGSHYVSFGHNGSTGGYLYQTFDTVIGQTYELRFAMAEQQGDDKGQQFSVCISPDGVSCAAFQTFASPNSTFDYRTFDFVATNTQTGLGITDTTPAGFGGGSNLALDDVSVNLAGAAPGVPEPATWALMLGGFAVAGAALRRRPARLAA